MNGGGGQESFWFGRLPALPSGERKFASAGGLTVEGPRHPVARDGERRLARMVGDVAIVASGLEVASGSAEVLVTDSRLVGVIYQGMTPSEWLDEGKAVGAFALPWGTVRGIHGDAQRIRVTGDTWSMSWNVRSRLDESYAIVGDVTNDEVRSALERFLSRQPRPVAVPVEMPASSVSPSGAGSASPSEPKGEDSKLHEDFELFEPWSWFTLLLTPRGRRIVLAAAAVVVVVAVLAVPALLRVVRGLSLDGGDTCADFVSASPEQRQRAIVAIAEDNGVSDNPLRLGNALMNTQFVCASSPTRNLGDVVKVGLGLSSGSSTGQRAAPSTVRTTVRPQTTTSLRLPSLTSVAPGGGIQGETPCPKADGTSARTTRFAQPPPMCIDTSRTYTAEMRTSKGTITLSLDPRQAPRSVNNFVVLARYRFYDGVVFHRVVPGFVIQGGDPESTGRGGPGYTFADELPAGGQYRVGSLVMAPSGPNTNGSQFFIILGDAGTSLKPDYSLFGQVTGGMDVVRAIEAVGSPEGPSSPSAGRPKEVVTIRSVTIRES